ncbi:hypothetical protein KCM76_22640 [Zooshikella marina]|uniref:hypothetical protein n=1 Tax=Zooshikella ganghwensis TaxID=202772 RepID=UPI001BB0ABEE|nr:hypothetical protein [Zooshikella ganghwensis]MBU2708809.1 hypothetical protein [Zooshikella ganghwensis]
MNMKFKDFVITVFFCSIAGTLIIRFTQSKKHGYKTYSWEEAIFLGLLAFVACIVAWGILTLKEKLQNRKNNDN